MRTIIRKILKESTLDKNIINKVYNHIKDDFWFEYNKDYRDGQVVTSFHTSEGSQIKGENGGISAQLGDNSQLSQNFNTVLGDQFGLSGDESLEVWKRIRFDLSKDRFIHSLPWGLYEEYIQYQEDPYMIDISNEGVLDFNDARNDVFNLRKLEDLKKFVEWVGWGQNEGSAHYDDRYNFLETMTTNDYEMLQKDILDYIERDLHL